MASACKIKALMTFSPQLVLLGLTCPQKLCTLLLSCQRTRVVTDVVDLQSMRCLLAGRSPPIGAYGAVLKAYARLRDADSAMDLLEEFQNEGGEPDDILVDMAVTACVRGGQFKRALKVLPSFDAKPCLNAEELFGSSPKASYRL